MNTARLRINDVISHPAHFFALGFGAGLSPRAPGTVGTLVAIPLYLLIVVWGEVYLPLWIALGFALGVPICAIAARNLGIHDHPGIVWDEIVGFWIAMLWLPAEWLWIAAGFVLFRLFDIVKPWPIGLIDRKVSGGLGVMLDDVLAGLMACACLHLIRLLGVFG
ncbi:MAG: phosphatidylglycerophosphatase A [Pseudomonadota bacterium]